MTDGHAPPRLRRRAALLLPGLAVAAAGCSVLPNRPYQEVQRFSLAPERPTRVPPPEGAPVLLLRLLRAAPGLDQRGLRVVRPDGTVDVSFWSEWVAPPPELAEEALRRWLAGSGLFSAVVAPGSRLQADLVMEGELVRLQAETGPDLARAGLSVLLLRASGQDAQGQARIRGQYLPTGSAPLPGREGGAGSSAPPAAAAAAMQAALGEALASLEASLRRTLARRPQAPAPQRR